ncbi:MAG: 5'/3'-nucleotidase SurE [Treponema sp.]|nr:5'/3'-nucleotidase SurE [Treponema sp.]
MNLLITNDDGYQSEGLKTLAKKLSENNNVYILAPSSNRSAVSHCIKMFEPVDIEKISDNVFSCSGFPADCAIIGLKSGIFPEIDAVISGINYGANIGTDILYSGTCSAARQASMYGKPGIAVSVEYLNEEETENPVYNFEPMAEFVAQNLESLISMCGTVFPYHFVNVNGISCDGYKGMKIAGEVAQRDYGDQVKLIKTDKGYKSVFIMGREQTFGGENSDDAIQKQGYVSVAKVLSEPVIAV